MTDETKQVPPASPWDTMANWGRTQEVPRVPETARPWVDAGPLPGTKKERRSPAWTVLAVVVAVVMALCVGTTLAINALVPDQEALRGPVSATETPAAALETEPAPARGTKEAPYAPGTRFTLPGWEVTVGATTSGKKVVDAVRKANQFNEPPARGETLVMVPVKVKRTDADPATPWVSVHIRFLAPDGVVRDGLEHSCGVVPKSLDEVGEMHSGATASGNVCVRVPTKALKGSAWIVSPLIAFGDRDRVYVDTRQ